MTPRPRRPRPSHKRAPHCGAFFCGSPRSVQGRLSAFGGRRRRGILLVSRNTPLAHVVRVGRKELAIHHGATHLDAGCRRGWGWRLPLGPFAVAASQLFGRHVQPAPDIVQAFRQASGGVVLYQVRKQAVGNAKLGLGRHKGSFGSEGAPMKASIQECARNAPERCFTYLRFSQGLVGIRVRCSDAGPLRPPMPPLWLHASRPRGDPFPNELR